jgi:hypothetical protein
MRISTKNALKHGWYTAEAIEMRRLIAKDEFVEYACAVGGLAPNQFARAWRSRIFIPGCSKARSRRTSPRSKNTGT